MEEVRLPFVHATTFTLNSATAQCAARAFTIWHTRYRRNGGRGDVRRVEPKTARGVQTYGVRGIGHPGFRAAGVQGFRGSEFEAARG